MGFFDKLKKILGIERETPTQEFKPVGLKEIVIEKAPVEISKVEIPLEVKLEEKPKNVKKQSGPKKAPRVPRTKKIK